MQNKKLEQILLACQEETLVPYSILSQNFNVLNQTVTIL
jgi:hypothetical protein